MALPIPSSTALLQAFRDSFEAGAASAIRSGQRFAWTATARLNLVRVACVRLVERLFFLLDDRFRASFLLTATGLDLDAWAASEAPGYPRKPATYALVRLTLSRGGAAPAGVISAGSRFSTTATASAPAVVFASLVDVVVPVGEKTAYVDCAAEVSGPDGNVNTDTVNVILTTLFDPAWSIASTTGYPAAGGADEETDDDYRVRLQQRDARYRRGTVGAIETGALGVGGVASVVVYDSMSTGGAKPDGSMYVIVCDQTGRGSDPMADLVKRELENWRAAGVTILVAPGVEESLVGSAILPAATSIRVAITTSRAQAVDQTAIRSKATEALRLYFRALRFSQPIHPAAWTRAVLDCDPEVRNVVFYGYPVPGSGTPIVADIAAPTTLGHRWAVADGEWSFSFTQET